MVEVIHDNYFMSFFIRLGTTSIGIIVSTLVNMFILPPNYIKEINQNINEIYTNLAKSLHYQINQKLHLPNEANFNYKHSLKKYRNNMKKKEELLRFKVNESKLLSIE